MATQRVNIEVSTKGAKKSKEELSGLNSTISKLGKAAGIATGAYFGAKGLISAFSTVIEASARQEQAEKALQVALGKTSTALLNQASALQKVTTAGDEAIIEQQAFLGSLKFTEEQIKTIIPVALDLSAATGISLESAVRNTSKTFSGLAGELGELVPQLRDLTQEEMKAGDAVKVLGELFEGQASKQAETLSGSLEQMSNSVGDASEAIGSLLAPMAIKTFDSIKVLAEGVSSLIDNVKNFGKEVEGILVDKVGKADEEVKTFKETIIGLGRDELVELGERLQGNKDIFVDYTSVLDIAGSTSETVNRKLAILNETIKEMDDANEKLNSKVGEGLEIRSSQIDQFGIIDEQFTKFVETQKANLISQEQEQQNIARLIQLYPKLAEQLELTKKTEASLRQEKEKRIQQDIRAAIISGQSAEQAMESVVRAETMEAISGLMSSIMKSTPFPLNLFLAAGAGAMAVGAMNTAMSAVKGIKFATGGDFVTSGPQMIMVGDNPGGRERVQVTPLSSPNINGPKGITINIQGNIIGTDEFVRDALIPQIDMAVRNNLA